MSVFLCVVAVLFFGSCADLSMDDEKAIKADLPADFNSDDYGKINRDVRESQVLLELKKIKKGENFIEKCVNFLKEDISFAEKIYLDYLQCPKDSWNKNEKCTGKFVYNSKYSQPTADTTYMPRDSVFTITNPDGTTKDSTIAVMDTIVTEYPSGCVIEHCWSEGWSETKFLETAKTGSGVVATMCQFIKPDASTLAESKDYLDKFSYDPYLLEQHYHLFGRSNGRPYKNCGTHGAEKAQNLKCVAKLESYYDYSKYTFCWDDTNQKIYVVNDEVCK